jgi:predicted RNase H-like HicB family nuclease
MTPKDYLAQPYARRLTPDPTGGYVATIQEFPGLIAEGQTAQEAVESLESAAESWIEAALDTGQEIPEPAMLDGYSGKIALRIPRGLHKRAAEAAAAEGASLNQWLVAAIANYLGAKDALREMANRAAARITFHQTATTSADIHLVARPSAARLTDISYFQTGNAYLIESRVTGVSVGVGSLPYLPFAGESRHG